MDLFTNTKSALKTRFQARAMAKHEMGHSVTKELAPDAPVTIYSGPKASDAVKKITKAINKVFGKAQPADDSEKSFKLLIDRMSSSSNKHGGWRKAKAVTTHIDATCDVEEDNDTNTPGDVAFIQAHQPADDLNTHQEVKEENKEEERTFNAVSVSQQAPVSATKPKFSTAGRPSDKCAEIKQRFKAVTFTKQAPTTDDGTPAWCVIDNIATTDLLDLINTQAQPTSGLRHTLLRLKASFAPKQFKSGPVKGRPVKHPHKPASLVRDS